MKFSFILYVCYLSEGLHVTLISFETNKPILLAEPSYGDWHVFEFVMVDR